MRGWTGMLVFASYIRRADVKWVHHVSTYPWQTCLYPWPNSPMQWIQQLVLWTHIGWAYCCHGPMCFVRRQTKRYMPYNWLFPMVAYLAVDDFIDAINAVTELDLHLPQSVQEWSRINAGGRQKSMNEIITGCVGALDGFFQCTNKPTKKQGSNQRSYWSLWVTWTQLSGYGV